MNNDTPKEVEFLATMPPSRAAFAFTGEGDAKVSLDTDATQLGIMVTMLLAMRGKKLRVKVEVVDE